MIGLLLIFMSVLNASFTEKDFSQGGDTISVKAPVKKLFTSVEPLKIIIQFEDLKKLKRDIGKNTSYHKAALTYFETDLSLIHI